MTSSPMHQKEELGKQKQELKIRFLGSLVCTLFLIFLPASGIRHLGIQAFLSTLLVFWCASTLLKHGLNSIVKCKFNTFTLCFLAIAISYGYSIAASGYILLLSIENVLHEMPIYFEAVGAIATAAFLGQLIHIDDQNRSFSYLAPILIGIAFCAFLLWNFLSPSSTYSEALMSAVSVLIISGPFLLRDFEPKKALVLALGITTGVLYPIFHIAMHPVMASFFSSAIYFLKPQKRRDFSFKISQAVGILALGGFTLLGSRLYQDWQASLTSFESLEKSLQRLLPRGETIVKIEPLKGGFANYIWEVYTQHNHYILREKRKIVSPGSFMRDLKISQQAFQYHMGPKVLGANTKKQQILLEYITHSSWPFYKTNFEPYQAAMKLLRAFHDQMPIHRHIDKKTIFAPFYSIFNMRNSLLATSTEIPTHFFSAAKKIEEVFQKIHPWLQKHARLCHGDFCKANVLLTEKLNLKLIDFDSSFLGDPFFDIIKFSASLPLEKRLELFKSYLGDKEPTLEQLCHFKLMDLTFLMVIATLRFQSAETSECKEEKLSKNSMEEILNSQEPLPSWSEAPFGNNSPKIKQTAALYALAEFLQRLPELESLISMVFSSEESVHIAE